MATIALAGNPNCGKSTIFNALTGARQRIGNWPGVTVERHSGSIRIDSKDHEMIDLPGLYDIDADDSGAEDERIVREYLTGEKPDLVINVVDATSLSRGLFLTKQLVSRSFRVLLVVNMIDVARKMDISIDLEKLSSLLGCPVVPLVATESGEYPPLISEIDELLQSSASQSASIGNPQNAIEVFAVVDQIVDATVSNTNATHKVTRAIDRIVLNRFLAIPSFLIVMYLMFLFTINVGSAFIDFFDIVSNAVFVESPRWILDLVGSPSRLTTLLADGVGGGVQLVCTFIPVIACLFVFLSFLEDSGYMGRIAFILDKLMQSVGLPGKSFIPLIVGFGCNVPSVMATRSLDSKPDRILTTIMAPFMSCGARLTVYALFAAAFFPRNGQNVVFALYLLGIGVALGSAWLVRKHLLPVTTSQFVLELAPYHLPTLRSIFTKTWHRLSGFVLRAGKAIVAVVIVLNVLNSLGTDGSFGNENTEESALSVIGKTITPVFAPIGIDDDNWPATVGIFTGMFAKEVVVGTLDALYSPATDTETAFHIGDSLKQAIQTIPANLSDLGGALADPMGLDIGDVTDTGEFADTQEVEINTIQAMRSLFDGQLGAFSYLVFILLYMPCVATIGAIYKELGAFWAAFSTAWSFIIAYAAAVICYQLGNITTQPVETATWCVGVAAVTSMIFYALVFWGRRQVSKDLDLIPIKTID